MRRVRLTFADGSTETIDLNLGDPFAAFDAAPLVAAHGPVVRSTLGPREDDSDGRPAGLRSTSLVRAA